MPIFSSFQKGQKKDKIPNGMMMKDSEMKKMTGKKKAKKGKKKYANA